MICCDKISFTLKKHKSKGEIYSDNIICFDTEASSGWIACDQTVKPYSKMLESAWYSDKTKVSLVYVWMLSIDGIAYYGRTLEEFAEFLETLYKIDCKFTIWVHNLSYDFNFLLNILHVDKMFARKPHRPIYFESKNVTFRCSYMLTRLSLEKWGESVQAPVKKLKGYLDYDILRTPNTNLTKRELMYCENDVLVMYYGIKKELEKYKHVEKIPLTQTGKCRNDVKYMYHDDVAYHKLMTSLLPDADMYAREIAVTRGGDTNCNYIWCEQYLSNLKSKDLTSGYPAWMAYYQYPMSPWQHVRNLNDWGGEWAKIIEVVLYGVTSLLHCNYLALYKAINKKEIILDHEHITFNGRIVKATRVHLYVTDVDLEIIKESYSIYDIEIRNVWVSRYRYLDNKYVKYVIEMFKGKTAFDGVDDDLYREAKERLNALFGMAGTALIQSNILFDIEQDDPRDIWKAEKNTAAMIEEKLEKLSKKPYKNYLRYCHAAWVLAYGRRELWNSILAIGDDVVYYDTDSNKHLGDHEDFFNAHNQKIKKLMESTCERVGCDISDLNPVSPNGKEKHLGFWADDGEYTEFVTIGAKRYCYRDAKDGHLHLTVSGVKKSAGVKELDDDIRRFNKNTVFGYDTSGSLQIHYLHDQPKVVWNNGKSDEYESDYRYGVCMFPSTYSMSGVDDLAYAMSNVEFKNNDNLVKEILMDGVL